MGDRSLVISAGLTLKDLGIVLGPGEAQQTHDIGRGNELAVNNTRISVLERQAEINRTNIQPLGGRRLARGD